MKCLEASKGPTTTAYSKPKCTVKKSSPIYKLDPLVVDGLLRVGGRLQHAQMDEDSKHPVILPKDHHVTRLIIRHYHHISGHSGRNYVLSMLRKKFWIIHGNSSVRRILASCVDCRKRQGPLGEQKMADLPLDRVESNHPSFMSIGIDYFGPYVIKRGRSFVKGYACIFTCLSTRAVHIEVTHSLDTDSFINCMRRFIARRGEPQLVRSDNGGSFVAGSKEIREAISEWNQKRIHDFWLQRGVTWKFNPPAGSHHGGVWECCIRTARKILTALLREQSVDEEGLITLMCEVEMIMNGRPLTSVSDDPRDPEVLTPNHLLLLRAGPTLPPGNFHKNDKYSKRRWRHIQYLSDQFWKRWTKEYLPLLQTRQKWNQPRRDFRAGDIVLVAQENSPRNSWPMGRIIETISGRDNKVRRVKIKSRDSVYDRPIDKCVLLEGDNPEADSNVESG